MRAGRKKGVKWIWGCNGTLSLAGGLGKRIYAPRAFVFRWRQRRMNVGDGVVGSAKDEALRFRRFLKSHFFVSHFFGGPEQQGVGAEPKVEHWLVHSGSDAEEAGLLEGLIEYGFSETGVVERVSCEGTQRLSALQLAAFSQVGEKIYAAIRDTGQHYWFFNSNYKHSLKERSALERVLQRHKFVFLVAFGPLFSSCTFTIIHSGSLAQERELRYALDECDVELHGFSEEWETGGAAGKGFRKMAVYPNSETAKRELLLLGGIWKNAEYAGPSFFG